MAEPGWYDDPGSPALLRWWDGTRWTEQTSWKPGAPQSASAPPPVRVKYRADGSLKGVSRRTALGVLVAGVLLAVVSLAVALPRFLDHVDGPRFAVPGSTTVDLDAGGWVLFEHTSTRRGSDGFSFETGWSPSIRPQAVVVTGPDGARVPARYNATNETVTLNEREYAGVVRFDAVVAGPHRIEVLDARDGEVMVTRPITDLVGLVPWALAGAGGALLAVVGIVLWVVGAANRRAAARAGGGPALYS